MAKGLHLVAMVREVGSTASELLLPIDRDFLVVEIDGGTGNVDSFHLTELAEKIREAGVHRVVIAGVSTSTGVQASVLGSIREGFETWLLVDAIVDEPARGATVDRALVEMRAAGAAFSSTGQMATLIKHQPEPTALVIVCLPGAGGLADGVAVAECQQVGERLKQLIEFGCRQIHRRAEEILA
jgi:hypothetical protein